MAFGINNITNLDQPVGRKEPADRTAERASSQRAEEETRREEEQSRMRGEEAQRAERVRSEESRKVDFFA